MKASRVLLGVVAGAAVGAVLGILFAPDKGENTRRKIARKAEDLRDDIKERANHLAEIVSDPFHRAEKREENGKAAASKMKYTEVK
jgi:gas vesicle protein